MIDLGKHAAFIWAAYGASVIVLGGLIAWIRLDALQQSRLLRELEEMGVRRRSARKKK